MSVWKIDQHLKKVNIIKLKWLYLFIFKVENENISKLQKETNFNFVSSLGTKKIFNFWNMDSTWLVWTMDSSMKHGISLRTLLRNSAKLSGPGLLVCEPFMS